MAYIYDAFPYLFLYSVNSGEWQIWRFNASDSEMTSSGNFDVSFSSFTIFRIQDYNYPYAYSAYSGEFYIYNLAEKGKMGKIIQQSPGRVPATFGIMGSF